MIVSSAVLVLLAVFVFSIISLSADSANPIGDSFGDSIDSSIDDISGTTDIDRVVLGYCPTMSDIARDIASKDSRVVLRQFSSASDCFSALDSGRADIVVVGRLAKRSEFGNFGDIDFRDIEDIDIFEKRLGDGLTLVGPKKRLVNAWDLPGLTVHTSEPEEKVRFYLPKNDDIVYHDSVSSAISAAMHGYSLSDIALIDWNDYSDYLELVIPVDRYLNKVEKFRIPVLYFYDARFAVLDI